MSQAAEGPMATAVRLQYAAGDTPAPSATRRRWRVLSLVALSSGLVLPFVPIECDATAANVLWEGGSVFLRGDNLNMSEWAVWLLAMPFFLIFPLVAWKVWQLAGRGPSSFLRIAALTIGGLGVAALAGMLVMLALNPDRTPGESWIYVGFTSVALGLVIWLEVVLLTRRGRWNDQITVAILGPYAVMLAFLVAVWLTSHKYGWYFSLAPCAGSLVELIVIARSVIRRDEGQIEATPPASG